MTIHEAWAFGRDQLVQASSTPEIDARLLLEQVLSVDHGFLIAHGDEFLKPGQEEAYSAMLKRAALKEPIPYITGKAPFYGFELEVDSSVLIPRPETEELVSRAVSWVGLRDGLNMVDVGTGSGCIAIALSCELPPSTITAVDISSAALKVARTNVSNLAEQNIHLVQGDMLAPFAGPFDLIVANLPYVADSEWTMVDDSVKLYEPSIALFGGSDGMDSLRDLLQQAVIKLRPGGAIFLEIGWQQGAAVRQIALEFFPVADVSVVTDFAGQDRIVQILTS